MRIPTETRAHEGVAPARALTDGPHRAFTPAWQARGSAAGASDSPPGSARSRRALLVSSSGTSAFAPGDVLFLAATVPLGLAVVVARRIAPSTPSSEITRYQTGFRNCNR